MEKIISSADIADRPCCEESLLQSGNASVSAQSMKYQGDYLEQIFDENSNITHEKEHNNKLGKHLR